MRVFGVTGWKNSGKTTLVAGLVRTLTARGHRISTVKHAHRSYEIDREGADTFAHRAAGAAQVGLVGDGRWALMSERAEVSTLADMLARMDPCDLVLVEGWKAEGHDKIECVAPNRTSDLLHETNDTIIALAVAEITGTTRMPSFQRNDVEAIADFIARRTGLS